jgi:antitoxin ParD1/3/4
MVMAISVDLGKKLESTVSKLVSKGRYNSKSEVLREGVRLVEEREKALVRLDAALAKGIADVEAGRVHSSEEVRAEVHKRMREIAARHAKKRA